MKSIFWLAKSRNVLTSVVSCQVGEKECGNKLFTFWLNSSLSQLTGKKFKEKQNKVVSTLCFLLLLSTTTSFSCRICRGKAINSNKNKSLVEKKHLCLVNTTSKEGSSIEELKLLLVYILKVHDLFWVMLCSSYKKI